METAVRKILVATFSQATSIEVMFEGNHCAVRIVCPSFANQKQLQRHQRVNACLKEYISTGKIHALRIDTQLPS